jgi:hypothetical protein
MVHVITTGNGCLAVSAKAVLIIEHLKDLFGGVATFGYKFVGSTSSVVSVDQLPIVLAVNALRLFYGGLVLFSITAIIVPHILFIVLSPSSAPYRLVLFGSLVVLPHVSTVAFGVALVLCPPARFALMFPA